jgi:1,4-dihydroxy-2-naphthoyl-CoA hydrolase
MDIEMMQQLISGLFADVLGVRFLEATPERVKGSLLVRDDLCTVPGVMHGGAIMAFADTLGAFATASNLAGAATTTIESKTNFLAAAASGTTIFGECTALHRGKRTMVWQTRVTAEDGRLLAMVTQTQAVLPAKPSEQEMLAALFTGKSVAQQQEMLARLERAGAALYRGWAAGEADPQRREVLEEAARREIQNAEVLEK